MDWSYVFFSISEGVPGLLALVLPVPFLMAASAKGYRLVAGSPGLVGAALFGTFAATSGATTHASPAILGFLPLAGLLLCLALIPRAIRALRAKWAAVLHVLTATGALFTWLAATMAIGHDWL